MNETSGDLDALKVAIAKHGLVSVGIDAAHKSLSFYSSGVYFEPKCGNSLGFFGSRRVSRWLWRNQW